MVSKQHILTEIKRTAKENGGVPLGWRKFQKETGIGQYRWQKYWARWADAQREAGLVANEKNIAYSNDYLIEKFIGLMRELGRYPAVGDVRVKGAGDSDFPNEATFRRFGTKAQFAASVVEYCRTRNGYDDISKLCALVSIQVVEKADGKGSNAEDDGFVYLIKSGRHYKIGKSNSAGRREYELAIQLPERPKTIHVIKTDDPSGIEAYWHKRFETKRKGGEWFALSPADVTTFRRRKFM